MNQNAAVSNQITECSPLDTVLMSRPVSTTTSSRTAGARPGVTRDTSRCPEARTTSAVLPAVPATRWCKKMNKKLTAGNASLFPNELCLRRRRRRLLLPQSPLFLHSTFYTNDYHESARESNLISSSSFSLLFFYFLS